EMWI
ncbi:DNA polymerase, beta-like region, partial [Gloeomargarita lithophora Alchichica-D10]